MFNLFKKKITILNEKWEVMIPLQKVDVVPRIDEYIYLEENGGYFKVIGVAHNYIGNKQGYFIIVEKTEIKKD